MAKAKKLKVKLPEPIHTDQRTCFGIAYFLVEADAQAFGDYYRDLGSTYIGGYFHGMPTGRDSTWDMTITQEHRDADEMRRYWLGKLVDLPVGTKVYAATY